MGHLLLLERRVRERKREGEGGRTTSGAWGIIFMMSISRCSFRVSEDVGSMGMNLTATISIVFLFKHEQTVPKALVFECKMNGWMII
jgi:hypothetical protein